MIELMGKTCKITICIDGMRLFYTVKEVLEQSDTHISFLDRYDNAYIYRLIDVVAIQEIK